MKAFGEPVSITYFAARHIDEGDVMETTTGRRYLVTAARFTTGKRPHWVLDCIVMFPADENPEGARVHGVVWFSRSRRRS